jgi:hypothetical protein
LIACSTVQTIHNVLHTVIMRHGRASSFAVHQLDALSDSRQEIRFVVLLISGLIYQSYLFHAWIITHPEDYTALRRASVERVLEGHDR